VADAEVIPIGAGGRPGRGSGHSGTPSAASRALAPTPSRTRRRRTADPDGAPASARGRTAEPTKTGAANPGSAEGRPAVAAATPATRRRASGTAGAAATTRTGRSTRDGSTPGSAETARAAAPAKAAPTTKATRPTKAARADKATRPTKPARADKPTRARKARGTPSVRTGEPRAAASAPEPVATPIAVTEPEPAAHGPVGQLAAILTELALQAFPSGAEEQAAEALSFLRRRITGDYEVDIFGFDRELTETVLLPVLRPLYQRWFRVEVRGIEHVPATGGALIVANHSGTVPVDSLMTQLALLDEHPARRNLRMLGADLVYKMPFVGQMARKSGATLACNEDAERLLGSGELVGVWPEGFKGVGKPFSERYKLQRFGRGGFVAAAMRTGAPIIPVSIVGAEEIYPLIGNLPTLARIIGVPYVPITPTFPLLGPLGLIPLPSKWIIEFGEPIRTDGHGEGAADDPMLVFNITDQVRETIQHSLYTLLMQRRSVFF
jgi:1-acyl-sn-glycerol-3-phosphate acyltransferase